MFYFQIDLKGLPPMIANRVMRRAPLGVHYLRQHLQRQVTNLPDSNGGAPTSLPFDDSVSLPQSNDASGRNYMYEEPVPVGSFTQGNFFDAQYTESDRWLMTQQIVESTQVETESVNTATSAHNSG